MLIKNSRQFILNGVYFAPDFLIRRRCPTGMELPRHRHLMTFHLCATFDHGLELFENFSKRYPELCARLIANKI